MKNIAKILKVAYRRFWLFFNERKYSYLKKANIISIGENCMLARNFRIFHLLKCNFGLEWMVTRSIATTTKLILNRFDRFFSIENLVYNPSSKCVVDTFYQIKSVHDYILGCDFQKEHDAVYKKLQRRIQRFKQVLDASKNAVLIYHYINREVDQNEINKLEKVLSQYYPQLPYYLCIIFSPRKNTELLAVGSVGRVLYIPYRETLLYRVSKKIRKGRFKNHGWKGDRRAWKRIFVQLNSLLKHAGAYSVCSGGEGGIDSGHRDPRPSGALKCVQKYHPDIFVEPEGSHPVIDD